MPLEPFSRRLLLQAAGAAFGTLAGSGMLAGLASAAASRSLDGSLLAWVILHPEQSAEIRLANFDRDGQLLGRAPLTRLGGEMLGAEDGALSAWGQMQLACAQAQALSLSAAARSWDARPEDCCLQPRRIAHRPSGRSIGFAVWADLA